MTIHEYDVCSCGIRGPHAKCREKTPKKEFGEFMQQALEKPSKYPGCQGCKHDGLPSCDPDCMEELIPKEKLRDTFQKTREYAVRQMELQFQVFLLGLLLMPEEKIIPEIKAQLTEMEKRHN